MTAALPSPSIHRYQLPIRDEVDLHMPFGAVPLHVAPVYLGVGPRAPWRIDLWCHVDLDADTTVRRFRVLGTGGPAGVVNPIANYVGTAVFEQRPGDDRGRGVWHVFDCGDVGGGVPG